MRQPIRRYDGPGRLEELAGDSRQPEVRVEPLSFPEIVSRGFAPAEDGSDFMQSAVRRIAGLTRSV
jgi:hypothetical protein